MAIKNHFQRYISVHKDKLTESYPPGSPYNEPLTEGNFVPILDAQWETMYQDIPVNPGDFVRVVFSYFSDGTPRDFGNVGFWLQCQEFEDWGGDSAPLTDRYGQWDSEWALLNRPPDAIDWTRFESAGWVPAGMNFLVPSMESVDYINNPPPSDFPWRLDQMLTTVNGEPKGRLRGNADDFPEWKIWGW